MFSYTRNSSDGLSSLLMTTLSGTSGIDLIADLKNESPCDRHWFWMAHCPDTR